jgi:hypothetical protein
MVPAVFGGEFLPISAVLIMMTSTGSRKMGMVRSHMMFSLLLPVLMSTAQPAKQSLSINVDQFGRLLDVSTAHSGTAVMLFQKQTCEFSEISTVICIDTLLDTLWSEQVVSDSTHVPCSITALRSGQCLIPMQNRHPVRKNPNGWALIVDSGEVPATKYTLRWMLNPSRNLRAMEVAPGRFIFIGDSRQVLPQGNYKVDELCEEFTIGLPDGTAGALTSSLGGIIGIVPATSGFLIAGSISATQKASGKCFVAYMRDARSMKWIKSFGSTLLPNNPFSLKKCSDGTYVFLYLHGFNPTGFSQSRAVAVKITERGRIVWKHEVYDRTKLDPRRRHYDATLYKEYCPVDFIEDPHGSIFLLSKCNGCTPSLTTLVLEKIDVSGRTRWSRPVISRKASLLKVLFAGTDCLTFLAVDSAKTVVKKVSLSDNSREIVVDE